MPTNFITIIINKYKKTYNFYDENNKKCCLSIIFFLYRKQLLKKCQDKLYYTSYVIINLF